MENEMRLTHVWQESGMGHAPYRFNGEVADAGFASECCKACGTAIRYLYTVYDRDNRPFIVGCECIKKTGDSRMTSDAIEAKKALDRAKREEKRRAAQEANLQAQRDRNGGLTDFEMTQQRIERETAERNAEIASRVTVENRWILDRFGLNAETKCEWRGWDGLLDLLETPIRDKSQRYIDIVCQMYCKTFGRGNSKAYRAAEKDFYARLDEFAAVSA